ncbi:MAG: ion transporter [Akkermansiaceae bacterium]|nr:ion transporter [Verrucomicrobiae bacterium]MCP5554913.1 ion transporter [Akkermansiaceae bacterium]
MADSNPDPVSWRERLWRVIFLSDTPAGRAFDVALLWVILLSVFTVVLESVDSWRSQYGRLFLILEWAFTGIFALEYLARLWVVRRRWRYVSSFFGVVDLLSVLPAFIGLFVPGTHYLMTLRVLRLMRMFRILKMVEYLGEASVLLNALKSSRRKIMVFLWFVLALVFVEGTIMYVLERDANPDFANIPQAIYWAIVTITTVGYGDVSPVTVLGKIMASVIMLTGFAIIAVPTGIVTSEIGREMAGSRQKARTCKECGWSDHGAQARYCQQCGTLVE